MIANSLFCPSSQNVYKFIAATNVNIWKEVHKRPFRNLKKETEERAVHSDSLGNSRKLGNPLSFGDKRTTCVSLESHYELELFSIYMHLSRVA